MSLMIRPHCTLAKLRLKPRPVDEEAYRILYAQGTRCQPSAARDRRMVYRLCASILRPNRAA